MYRNIYENINALETLQNFINEIKLQIIEITGTIMGKTLYNENKIKSEEFQLSRILHVSNHEIKFHFTTPFQLLYNLLKS